MWRLVPRDVRVDAAPDTAGLRQRVVAAAALVAALTFAVMIGTFYIGQQYLQLASGYSALGAAAALTLIALLVTIGAPVTGILTVIKSDMIVPPRFSLSCANFRARARISI